MHRILKEERDIVIASPPLEATEIHFDNIRWAYVFYEPIHTERACCKAASARALNGYAVASRAPLDVVCGRNADGSEASFDRSGR